MLCSCLFLSKFVNKFVYITVSEQFSFNKIIHPPDRCGISRSWLNSVIITQVHLVPRTIKCHYVQFCHTTQCHRCQVEWVCDCHADCRHVHQSCCQRIVCYSFSTISRIQHTFRELGSMSNRPHNRRPRVTTPVHNRRISAETRSVLLTNQLVDIFKRVFFHI